MDDDYQFADIDNEVSAAPQKKPAAASFDRSSAHSSSEDSKSYAQELFSKQIKAKLRTFYIDLKQSANGKFVKVSEKSHGRKSTIMMDAEDVSVFIEALQEVQKYL